LPPGLGQVDDRKTTMAQDHLRAADLKFQLAVTVGAPMLQRHRRHSHPAVVAPVSIDPDDPVQATHAAALRKTLKLTPLPRTLARTSD
jgi:hypothetical protein